MKKFDPKLYEVLGRIPQNATPEEIKEAYKTLAKLYHPDKNPDDLNYANEMMGKLNEAYTILSDPNKRAQYDSELNTYLRKIEEERLKSERKQKESHKKKMRESESNRQNKKSVISKKTNSSGLGALVGVGLVLLALGLLIDTLSDE